MTGDRTAIGLEQTRRRIAHWRGTRRRVGAAGTAMPAALWAAAVLLARQHGVSPTARALHVNYLAYLALKKHLDATGFVPRPGKTLDGRRDGRRVTTRAHDGTRRGARGRQHHGLSLLKRAVAQLGARPLDQALDPQSPIGQALAQWRRELTADLGGPESITTTQAGMVELAVRTKLVLDTVDAFILTMESPVNKRRRMVYPVIIQRQMERRSRTLHARGAPLRARHEGVLAPAPPSPWPPSGGPRFTPDPPAAVLLSWPDQNRTGQVNSYRENSPHEPGLGASNGTHDWAGGQDGSRRGACLRSRDAPGA